MRLRCGSPRARRWRAHRTGVRPGGKQHSRRRVAKDGTPPWLREDVLGHENACFRNSEAIPAIVEEAKAINAKVIWMQLGVSHSEAARDAEEFGMRVVMNRCPKIEFGRLSGEIAYMGGTSRVISSKRNKLLGKRK